MTKEVGAIQIKTGPSEKGENSGEHAPHALNTPFFRHSISVPRSSRLPFFPVSFPAHFPKTIAGAPDTPLFLLPGLGVHCIRFSVTSPLFSTLFVSLLVW